MEWFGFGCCADFWRLRVGKFVRRGGFGWFLNSRFVAWCYTRQVAGWWVVDAYLIGDFGR